MGATGVPLLVKDLAREPEAFVRPEWLDREGIRSFGCQPLVFRGEILGALAVFNRQGCDEDTFAWLRAFADHAAVALANSRAFSPPPPASERATAASSPRSPRTEAELRRAAREATLAALHESEGRIYGPGGAAERLGVKPTTLACRLKALGLRRQTSR